MDFNDIKTRLERVYSSINARFDNNIEKHVKKHLIHIKEENKVLIGVSFNKISKEVDDLNKIIMIIHNLANLKDHLKSIISGRDETPEVIEQEINNSFDLQLIIDLSNQEKHGYPLTRTNRSGKNPQIRNVNNVLQLTGSSSVRISMNGKVESQGNVKVSIIADITDENGNKIVELDKLIGNAISKWEEVIKKYNLA